MKGEGMNMKYWIYLFMIVLASSWCAGRAHAENKFNIRPGAEGKICLTCHVDFKEKLAKKFVHTPVKMGDCTGCHNPHASSHGKLLSENTNKVCFTCHPTIIPEKAQSSHRVVTEGGCVNCHDPHSSGNRNNLLKAGNDLCYGCHADMESFAKVKHKHVPVEQSCVTCHAPHGSSAAASLLKDDVPKLCTNCHQTSKPFFKKVHGEYPVEDARCTSCHSVHGSDKAGMLFNTVHPPVANRMCNQCHEGPGSRTPLKTKRDGYELCKSCHNNKVSEILGKKQLHWGLFGEDGCLACHSPHAAKMAGLLRAPVADVCGACHKDTIERISRVKAKHNPVKEGMCVFCHDPHSSDSNMLISRENIIELCGSCHDWQKHQTHPLGPDVIDRRNPNLSVSCLSCHRAHGTDSKYIVHYATVADTCTQCHKEYKR